MPENNDGNKKLIVLFVFLVVCGYSIFNNQDKVNLSFSVETDQYHFNFGCGYEKDNSESSILIIQRCIVKELMARIISMPKNLHLRDEIWGKNCLQKKYPMFWIKKTERIYEDVLQLLQWICWNREKKRLEFTQGWGVGV